jgi:hypothetical protein
MTTNRFMSHIWSVLWAQCLQRTHNAIKVSVCPCLRGNRRNLVQEMYARSCRLHSVFTNPHKRYFNRPNYLNRNKKHNVCFCGVHFLYCWLVLSTTEFMNSCQNGFNKQQTGDYLYSHQQTSWHSDAAKIRLLNKICDHAVQCHYSWLRVPAEQCH